MANNFLKMVSNSRASFNPIEQKTTASHWCQKMSLSANQTWQSGNWSITKFLEIISSLFHNKGWKNQQSSTTGYSCSKWVEKRVTLCKIFDTQGVISWWCLMCFPCTPQLWLLDLSFVFLVIWYTCYWTSNLEK